jgi:predicted nucleic acid-binding protein
VTVFIDTNVVVYSIDTRTPAKKIGSSQWLRELSSRNALVVNQQVLREAYRVIAAKHRIVSVHNARKIVLDLLPLATAPDGAELWELAWSLQDRYRTGWWDSLLLSSAIAAGCRWFLTEDRGIAPSISEIVIVDAFSADMSTILDVI